MTSLTISPIDLTDPKTIAAVAEIVEQRQTRRSVTWAFIAALITASAIALPVTILIGNENAQTQRDNAEFVCNQAQAAADIQRQVFADQVESNRAFQEQSDDTFGLTRKQFDDLIKEGEKRDAATLADLEQLADANCDSEIH